MSGEGIYFSLHPAVRRQAIVGAALEGSDDETDGNGLVALWQVKMGEVIWTHSSKEVELKTRAEMALLSEPDRSVWTQYAWQVADDLHEGPRVRDGETAQAAAERDATSYINHSCDPNIWFDDTGRRLVARRDIQPGEQIVFDYATCESHFIPFTTDCLCGADNCRKLIRPSDWKLPELQQRYDGHFKPYLQKHIDEANTACTVDEAALRTRTASASSD